MVPNAAMLAPKTRPRGVPHRVLGVIFEVFEALGGLGRFGRVLRPVLHGSWVENVANMAPSWLPKSSPHRGKIGRKIDPKFDASWDRFVRGFWWILGGKMEACWHQTQSKIDVNFERRFFEKSCSRCSGGSIFQVRGVEVGSKNQ